MTSAVISRRTADALERVMQFFAIDPCNRHLFGEAAHEAGVESFERTIEALDSAIQRDPRAGITRRIKARIEQQRALDRQGVKR